MDTIIRVILIYLFLLVLLRASGRRALSELTGFDLILLLIAAEVTDSALLGHYSFVQAILTITALFTIDIGFSFAKQKFQGFNDWIDGTPVVIVKDGKLLPDRMKNLRIDREEILRAARESHGLTHLEQVRYAVAEASGTISIIPRS